VSIVPSRTSQAANASSRLLGSPFAMGKKLTKAMPPAVMGKEISLSGMFDPKDERYSEASEFRSVHEADGDAQRVVELARGIEGLKRQWGVHAAGVIMSSEPLIDIRSEERRVGKECRTRGLAEHVQKYGGRAE